MPAIVKVMPLVISTAPAQSSRLRAFSATFSVSTTRAAIAPAAAAKTLTKNTHRPDGCGQHAAKQRAGGNPGGARAADHAPSARSRAAGSVNAVVSSASAVGAIAAAPRPCTARPANNPTGVQASLFESSDVTQGVIPLTLSAW
jgi:hypothetical protein